MIYRFVIEVGVDADVAAREKEGDVFTQLVIHVMSDVILALSSAGFRPTSISGADSWAERERRAFEERDAWREAFFEKMRQEDVRVAAAIRTEDAAGVCFKDEGVGAREKTADGSLR